MSVVDPQRDILKRMHDPKRISVSKDCVQPVDNIYDHPIVRAGSTSSEALLEWLSSQSDDLAGPPPGFGAAPGDQDGLPTWLKRVPGKGLGQARKLFDAFQQPGPEAGKHLGKPQDVPETTGWPMNQLPSLDALFKETYEAHNHSDPLKGDVWDMAWTATYMGDRVLTEEKEKEAAEGLPYSLHLHDYFDLEGREYRQRAERAQCWNRPAFEPKLAVTGMEASSRWRPCGWMSSSRRHRAHSIRSSRSRRSSSGGETR